MSNTNEQIDFKTHFADFIWERIKENSVSGNPGYEETRDKVCSVFDKIKSLLADNKGLVFELESSMNFCASFQIESAYKQGLRDGMILREELGINEINYFIS